jgi:phosphoenolpyruvate carboxylase
VQPLSIECYGNFALFRLSNWENPTVDIIPLFESVDDLQNAHEMMEKLYSNFYAEHLARRNNKQTIMLGFSDGTKTAVIWQIGVFIKPKRR